MQAFTVRRQNGVDTTTAIDQSLIKVFKDVDSLNAAIEAGLVKEGEVVSTIDDDKPNKLPTDQLRQMQEEIRAIQEDLGHIDDALPSDVSSDNLIASINAVLGVVESLDVPVTGGAGKYIKAISETDGKITPVEETLDTTVTQGSTVAPTSGAVYTAITNASIGASTALQTAIQALDVASVGGTNKYISAIEETDGKISATAGTIDTVVTASSNNLITSGAVNSALSTSETALQGNINAVNGKLSSTASSSDKCPAASEVASEIGTAISTEVTNRNTAITNAINALDVGSAGGAGQYIQSISETNGKISATAANFPQVGSGITASLSGTVLTLSW